MTTGLQERENINFGGGDSGFGGAIGMILLVVIVLWLLFKDGNGNHGGNHGGGHYGGYPNLAPDMPSYMVDKDVIAQGCADRAATTLEAEKTRALIVHENERASDKEYFTNLINNQATLAAKDSKIQSLEAMIYGDRQFNALQKEIGMLECEVSKLPKPQPEYAQMCAPVTRPLDSCYPYPRENNCYA